MITYHSVLLRKKNSSDKICRETKTRILCSMLFFVENLAVYEIMFENIVEPSRPDDNMAHAHCMLDTYVYKHTLKIRNNYPLSTATMFARERINVRLCVHCCVVNIKMQSVYCAARPGLNTLNRASSLQG